MEYRSGIVGSAPPIDGNICSVALGVGSRDGTLQRIGVVLLFLKQTRLNALDPVSTMRSQLRSQGWSRHKPDHSCKAHCSNSSSRFSMHSKPQFGRSAHTFCTCKSPVFR